ncbi:MarR family winged helix-turn-helix transcriptional regulator [Nakamurella lactea]|uniref:MarR family winged helix-turn-helix transcriptional regulator n=1 Tax=Nakamurella lactea TaxID=459515 RepID=UPI00042371D5|nr:MarR family transcriptional regulator [Nakamurella lactea]
MPSRPEPSAPSVIPELADRLTYLLKHAQLRLAELSAAALEPLGISGRELAVLRVIAARPPVSQLEIATRMGVDRTTMVGLIDGLERKKLVERAPDPADRRRNVVALTAAGRTATQRGSAAADRAEQTFLEPLSADEASAARRALRLLAFPGEERRRTPEHSGEQSD